MKRMGAGLAIFAVVGGVASVGGPAMRVDPPRDVDRTVLGTYQAQLFESWGVPGKSANEICLRSSLIGGTVTVRYSKKPDGAIEGTWSIREGRKTQYAAVGPTALCASTGAGSERWEGTLERRAGEVAFRQERSEGGVVRSVAFSGPVAEGKIEGTLTFTVRGTVARAAQPLSVNGATRVAVGLE